MHKAHACVTLNKNKYLYFKNTKNIRIFDLIVNGIVFWRTFKCEEYGCSVKSVGLVPIGCVYNLSMSHLIYCWIT